jgi:hypothetical protein
MAGYIGSKTSVTQIDGYNRTEADAEFVNDPNSVITVSGSNVGIGTSSPAATLNISGSIGTPALYLQSSDQDIAYAGTLQVGDFDGTTFNERMSIDSSGNMDVQGTVTAAGLSTTALMTNQIRGMGNVSYYHNDYDASSSGVNGHLFYTNNGTIPYGGFQSNDFYIQDNLSVGRVRLPDDSYSYNTDGTSVVTLYSSNSTTGPAAYKNYTQILSRNSTDPDYGLVMASSAYVESQTPDTAEADQHAFVIDNGGRIWTWQSHYAGRTRRGDTGTTANYRVGDHGFTGYSNTGGTHGESVYNGYTQIFGRETANSDMVFRVSVAGSDRIHFYANGNGYFDGGADLGNADYAEYFEWSDGNPNNEDRRGYSVVLENGKIRIATSEDTVNDLIGIVSVHAAICGDAAHMAWQGKYQLDKFGARVTQDVNHTCWMDKPDGDHHESDEWDCKYTDEYIAANNIEVPDHAQVITTQEPVESEAYDPQTEYIPRADRPEWSPIGLMGKLPLLKGEPVHPRWIKLYEMNDELDMWLVR